MIFRDFCTSFSTCWNGIAYLLERYRLPAGTVSPTCWNGIAYLLERYRLPAGTVSDSTAALSRQVPAL
jgi:hypothetical protein